MPSVLETLRQSITRLRTELARKGSVLKHLGFRRSVRNGNLCWPPTSVGERVQVDLLPDYLAGQSLG